MPRYPVRLDMQWEGLSGNHSATVSDVSIGGCFIESIGQVNVGEVLGIRVQLPTERWISLRGEVRYYFLEIGFGVQIIGMSDADAKFWQSFIEYLAEENAPTR
jgi:hypothetical protein